MASNHAQIKALWGRLMTCQGWLPEAIKTTMERDADLAMING